MEDYAAKMQLKTDAALREYVNGYAQYREAAVLAAFDELRRRGQPAPKKRRCGPRWRPPRPGSVERRKRPKRPGGRKAEAEEARPGKLTGPPRPVFAGTSIVCSVMFPDAGRGRAAGAST